MGEAFLSSPFLSSFFLLLFFFFFFFFFLFFFFFFKKMQKIVLFLNSIVLGLFAIVALTSPGTIIALFHKDDAAQSSQDLKSLFYAWGSTCLPLAYIAFQGSNNLLLSNAKTQILRGLFLGWALFALQQGYTLTRARNLEFQISPTLITFDTIMMLLNMYAGFYYKEK